jgi:hypothetical protein
MPHPIRLDVFHVRNFVPCSELVLLQGVREDKMIKHGPRHKQATSLGERLARFSRQVREQAVALPPGEERAALMRKLEQSEQAVRISEWLGSPAPTSNQPLNKVP